MAAKTTGLPTRGLVSLNHEKSDAGGVARGGIEQGTQNFFLRRARLNLGNGVRELGRPLGADGFAGLGGNFLAHAAGNVSAQLGRMVD